MEGRDAVQDGPCNERSEVCSVVGCEGEEVREWFLCVVEGERGGRKKQDGGMIRDRQGLVDAEELTAALRSPVVHLC